MAANNPRKFEEKIAQHKLRQAQETKEFEKIMQEMSFVNAIKTQSQTQRQTRGRYGGSLPDFSIAQSQNARHDSLTDMSSLRHTDGQLPLKDRPYHRNRHMMNSSGTSRRHMDSSSPYHFSPYLSPPQVDPNWRRTSSDSSIYHTLTNPNIRHDDVRKMSTSPDSTEVGSYLTPKDNEMPDIKLCPSGVQQQQQQQQQTPYGYQPVNGSLPDLANLHIPSPLPTSIDGDDQQQQQQAYKQNFAAPSANVGNVFLRQPQPRRNTTGSSCNKKQLYHRHPQMGLDPLQVSGQPSSNYMQQYQQQSGGGGGGSPGPSSPTCVAGGGGGNMYPSAPMSPLANVPGYLQYQSPAGAAMCSPQGLMQQQLEQMATIAENLKPSMPNGQMMQQGIPPQSPNTFLTNMLSQNPAAMEIVRERFQDVVFGGGLEPVQVGAPPGQLGNSLAQDIGDAIGGYELGAYRGMYQNNVDLPPGMSLAPLNIEDIEVLTGGSAIVADEAVEAEFRREGQQLM